MRVVAAIALTAVCGLASWEAASAQQSGGSVPLYKVTLVGRTTPAVNYSQLHGSTRIDFRGTPLLARAEGRALIRDRKGAIAIVADFHGLEPATQFGPQFLTYVVWAITPEGRATNLGELVLDGDDSFLRATTELRVFALIVSAEPHFAVSQPSDVVVLENVVRADTAGKVQLMDAKYELLERGHYTLEVQPVTGQPERYAAMPLELRQARLAVALARSAGAEQYAAETFQRATQLLGNTEKQRGKKRAARMAREVVQTAEDARLIAVKRGTEERLAQERRAGADREARAQAETAEETQRRAAAEAERARADQERMRAEQGQQRAQQAQIEAERARADAERVRAEAMSEAERAERQRLEAEAARQAAESEAAGARMLAQEAENERTQLRMRLQEQLNLILETRDSARGLVVNMSDVLFETGQYRLQPGAREKLAKITGIVLAHPGLELQVEGHTDSVGAEDYNQKLSEQRAGAVRDYLVQQGLAASSISAQGFGETLPVTSNDSAAERQQNRRVEIVVSGDPIGL